MPLDLLDAFRDLGWLEPSVGKHHHACNMSDHLSGVTVQGILPPNSRIRCADFLSNVNAPSRTMGPSASKTSFLLENFFRKDFKLGPGPWDGDDEDDDKNDEAAFNGGVHVCAEEGEVCECTGLVHYGVGDGWTSWREVGQEIACNNSVFGDPNVGKLKRCECREAGAETPSEGYWRDHSTGAVLQSDKDAHPDPEDDDLMKLAPEKHPQTSRPPSGKR
eukprot:gnl/MRDRNA2_/MRDRNA2_124036_c0_seq1.p1 gnl/MRDRNA2_/MRDRNA2_124036_c0~~gnl/MRDRNA2_/MRDRNA2_124036_c0_seq1.p1  ORF type:complete len:219 (-),score=39.95 gnl/MRDRNA2_/MRDRNA2_124036_c0_seq1:114-770(-)